MDYCTLATDDFLNSTFFNTLIMGILSALLVLATILIAWRQHHFQKKSHEQQLLAARENRILGIYKAFAETYLVLIPFRSSANISFILFPKESQIKRLRNHYFVLLAASDEAKLLFEKEAQLIKRLKEICDHYFAFFNWMFDTKKKLDQPLVDEVFKIKAKYPAIKLNNKDDFFANPEILQELNEATRFPLVEKLEEGIKNFLRENL